MAVRVCNSQELSPGLPTLFRGVAMALMGLIPARWEMVDPDQPHDNANFISFSQAKLPLGTGPSPPLGETTIHTIGFSWGFWGKSLAPFAAF